MKKSGIVDDCICGATGVPVKLGFGLYAHRDLAGNRCLGELAEHHFNRMLRNAELALGDWGHRLMTDNELDAVHAKRLSENHATP